MGLTRFQLPGDRQELPIATLVFALCVTLSLLAFIIIFCAEGVPKNSKKDTEDSNYRNGGSVCGGGGCGSACGGGCGG
ncbi:hypothetical protein Fmac_023190 [Flemingia macrophylla]|uniref:Transmembrane protein n=1 Tax=Flemingia macrophylla TaxID=520843 RepID=A0ABD1LKS7_9FABA